MTLKFHFPLLLQRKNTPSDLEDIFQTHEIWDEHMSFSTEEYMNKAEEMRRFEWRQQAAFRRLWDYELKDGQIYS